MEGAKELGKQCDKEHVDVGALCFVAYEYSNCHSGVEVGSGDGSSDKKAGEQRQNDSENTVMVLGDHVNGVEQKSCADIFVDEHDKLVVFG